MYKTGCVKRTQYITYIILDMGFVASKKKVDIFNRISDVSPCFTIGERLIVVDICNYA